MTRERLHRRRAETPKGSAVRSWRLRKHRPRDSKLSTVRRPTSSSRRHSP